MATTLPLTPIADVTYDIPPTAAPRRGFDVGLIMDDSGIITTSDRVVEFTSLAEIIDAGATTSSPVYLAAQKYFASPSNPSKVALGAWGSGETAVEAFTACREANAEWYSGYVIGADNTAHQAIGEYVEASMPYTTYFMQSADSAIKTTPSSNIFHTLKGLNYRRTLGMFSSVNYAVASIMGYAMGATNDLANSKYTLMFKEMPGVATENLTSQEVTNIQSNWGNAYLNRGKLYTIFENGKTFNGGWFDETIYLDKLANEIQLNVMDLLISAPAVAQTEEGMSLLKTVIDEACKKLRRIGFIAPGVWNGGNILTLSHGDYMPNGWMVMSEPIALQDQADRDARKAPPIYVAIKLAGAIHSVIIRVNVNR